MHVSSAPRQAHPKSSQRVEQAANLPKIPPQKRPGRLLMN